ncbi:MAG: MerR family transcriptional regulator [Oceanococcaceae bacterium]
MSAAQKPKRRPRGGKTAEGGQREYTVDELARAAGTTVRNVRAYQDRGLLPAPEIRGRTGYYGENHLARLRIIAGMLGRGYTLNSIGELMAAWQEGRDLTELLGLEVAITRPFMEELAETTTLQQLREEFSGDFSASVLSKAVALDIVRMRGQQLEIPSPRLLAAGRELATYGIPMEELLDLIAGLRANVERVANSLVGLVAEYVIDPTLEDGLPRKEQVSLAAEMIWKLRPLVEKAVIPEVSRAMHKALENQLGDRLALVMDYLAETRSGPADEA